jgi:hypothetical protein
MNTVHPSKGGSEIYMVHSNTADEFIERWDEVYWQPMKKYLKQPGKKSHSLNNSQMKEFMLLIRTEGDHLLTLSPEERQKHIQKVMVYIEDLMKTGKLKSAQPLDLESVIISGTKGKLKDGPFNEAKEVIAGYFLILAKDMKEAIEIGKRNPVFEIATTTRIEVRPIQILEGIND